MTIDIIWAPFLKIVTTRWQETMGRGGGASKRGMALTFLLENWLLV